MSEVKLHTFKNVLVTGGAGFIGTNFVRYLLTHYPKVQVVTLDSLTYAGSLENLRDLPDAERHNFVKGDINDQELVEQLIRQYQIDTIVNFAAESHVDRSIIAPEDFVHTNIQGAFRLLNAAKHCWLEEGVVAPENARFLHVSTDEVYGSLEPGDPPFSEATPYAPRSPYAASKAAADHLVGAYHYTYGLPCLITNCSNNYGPYQFPEKLLPLMMINALEGRPLPIYGDGQQIRDWIYVEDHCRAIDQVLRMGQLGEKYNIGGNNQPTNLALVQALCAQLDQRLPQSPQRPHAQLIEMVADRPGHDRRYAMDTSKITAELGWEPQETLESGLDRMLDWYLENDAWLDHIRQRPDYEAWIAANYTERSA